MATTFTCPHCQAIYPFKPVLIGRPVRCTTCRQAFQLGADGIALAVSANLVATNRVPTKVVDGTRTRTPLPPSSQALVKRSGKTPPPAPPAPPAPGSAAVPPAAGPKAPPSAPATPKITIVPPAAPPPAASAPTAPAKPTATAPAKPVGPAAITAADPAKPTAASVPAKPATAAGAQASASPATATAATATAPPSARLTRASARLNTRGAADQAFRQKLFAGLDQVAAKAAAADDHDDGAKPTTETKSSLTSDGYSAPPVLTHSGEQESRSRRHWLIGSAIAVVLVVVAWQFIGHSAQRRALEAYASPAAVQSGPFHGTFFSSLTQRSWLVGRALPLRDLGTVSIQSTRSLPIGAAKDIFKTLVTTKTYLNDRGVWVDQAAVKTVPTLWDAHMDIAGNLAALHAHNIDGVDQHDVVMKCRETGLSPDDVDLLMELLLGTTDAKGGNLFLEHFRKGEFPNTLRVADFSGHGTALIYTDSGYQSVVIDYDGRLMQVVGAGWPADWQVLDLHQRDRDHAAPAGNAP